MIELKYGAKTDKGKVRELNEDSFLANGLVFAVADGMGGHQAGEVASALALEIIKSSFTKIPAENLKSYAQEAIKKANSKIFFQAQKRQEQQGMGTTLTLAIPHRNEVLIAQVGDSRAYHLRGDNLKQATVDHSLVQDMVASGKLSREEAQTHPMRSVITRALGAEETVEVDFIDLEVKEKDRILLATDGLTSMLSEDEIARIVKQDKELPAICDELVEEANQKGGTDNITVVLLEATTRG